MTDYYLVSNLFFAQSENVYFYLMKTASFGFLINRIASKTSQCVSKYRYDTVMLRIIVFSISLRSCLKLETLLLTSY